MTKVRMFCKKPTATLEAKWYEGTLCKTVPNPKRTWNWNEPRTIVKNVDKLINANKLRVVNDNGVTITVNINKFSEF